MRNRLLRVRDLTPFGIQRLDVLPAHAVTATPGTWALEVNLSYQNTYVLSDDVAVAEYLRERGDGRGAWFYRFALTENLQNFLNTPDVGLTFSLARVVFGR